jgi:hypothetical protein
VILHAVLVIGKSGMPDKIRSGIYSSGTVGAINELRVSVDLLCKGYAVFRALSPHCPCDLVLLLDHRVFRVEVTTGHRTSNGKLMIPRKDATRYDVLAVVFPDSIVYSTELPELRHLMSLEPIPPPVVEWRRSLSFFARKKYDFHWLLFVAYPLL